MKLYNFRLNVLLRILFVMILGYLSYYVIVEKSEFWLLFFWLILFAIVSFIELIRYIEKFNRELNNFLIAIKQNDFSHIYPENHKRSKSLHKTFNIITREFIKIRSEKESNYHFLKTIVEHSGVPLLAFEIEGKIVTLINKAAKELFHIPYLTKLESLRRINGELLETIETLESDEKVLLKTELNGEIFHLSVVAKKLILQNKTFKLIAFHNINSELDQKEIESWQKLIRVLTHEIKNSVIPISTLTEVINTMLHDETGGDKSIRTLKKEDEDDLRTSLKTIERRSKGLVRFVTSYGELARIPRPKLEEIDIVELVNQIIDLEKKELTKSNIKLSAELPALPIILSIDPGMIAQVLINLLKNAIEALVGQSGAEITIKLNKKGSQCTIAIADNGPGIDKETLDSIFVPFFTTKEKGSGIGLSLSRQIIRAHKGNLRVFSKPGEGAIFELIL